MATVSANRKAVLNNNGHTEKCFLKLDMIHHCIPSNREEDMHDLDGILSQRVFCQNSGEERLWPLHTFSLTLQGSRFAQISTVKFISSMSPSAIRKHLHSLLFFHVIHN